MQCVFNGSDGEKNVQQKVPVSYPNLTRNTRFVPARILFPKGEEHEDGQNWIEQFRVRFALQAQLFQGQRKGQAQRALDNIRPHAAQTRLALAPKIVYDF